MARLSRCLCPFFSMWMLLSVIVCFPDIANSSTKIPAEDIKTTISDHVERNHPWPSGSVRIHILTRLSDVVLPQESVTFEVVNYPDKDFIGDATFTVKYYSEGNVVKEETVRVGMEVLMDVVVSKRELVKNREVTAEDVYIQKKWLKRIPANIVTIPADIVGKTLTFNVHPHSEITKNNLRTLLLIKRGNVVRIVFDNDSLNVTTMGVSEEDGAKNKIIRVKNLSSNRTIYARVTGDSLVKVEF
jgi:flagellar basal body P-ring formation protein FlgA